MCKVLCKHWDTEMSLGYPEDHNNHSPSLLPFLATLPSLGNHKNVPWSQRGCDCLLTPELDLGNQRLLAPSPILEAYGLPTVSTAGAEFKDAALRKKCVVETIWTEFVTETLKVSINLRFWQMWWDLLFLRHPRQASCVSSLHLSTTTYQSGVAISFLGLSLPSLSEGQFQISPGKLLSFRTSTV